ncbi:MAG TPA: DoxX family protein [Spirochaetia bacterium]|nr:DoxX family protein [Spirochaetia bacterium]
MPSERMLDVGRLILRLTLAGLILFHGIDKVLHGIAWMSGPLRSAGLPQVVGYGVFLGEVVAPLFVILGLGTRVAALVIVANMVMALVLDAGRFILTINSVGGWGVETEAFYLLSAVTLFFVGGGGISVTRGKGILS